MKLFVAADFCPRKKVAALIEKGQGSDILACWENELRTADFSIVNFETSVAPEGARKIRKRGPCLGCSPKAVELLAKAGFKGVSVANNHFYDYGEAGLRASIDAFKANGLQYVGAGADLQEAARPLILGDTAIIAACEREFSIAGRDHGGCNHRDPIDTARQIKAAKEQCSKVIVISHAGLEGLDAPSPGLRKRLRVRVECGADMVINHHQHCPLGCEQYLGTRIFYGLGNFCFPSSHREDPSWYLGYALMIDTDDMSAQILPYRQCAGGPILEKLSPEEWEPEWERLCALVADEALCERIFRQWVREMRPMKNFLPYRFKPLRMLYDRGWLPDFLSRRQKLCITDAMRCESIHEACLDSLDK